MFPVFPQKGSTVCSPIAIQATLWARVRHSAAWGGVAGIGARDHGCVIIHDIRGGFTYAQCGRPVCAPGPPAPHSPGAHEHPHTGSKSPSCSETSSGSSSSLQTIDSSQNAMCKWNSLHSKTTFMKITTKVKARALEASWACWIYKTKQNKTKMPSTRTYFVRVDV